jgi:ATP-dependent DNA helicase RecG
MSRIDSVIAGIGRKIANGDRCYWVCPLIEESDVLDLTYAEKRFQDLKQAFPGQVGIVHGRLKNVEKDQAIESFRQGEIRILVSTTVVEVGVDVPQATVMVIENAERFGLSQLHQLRGRVGRSDVQSYCILLFQEPAGEMARARLTIMRESDDGFRIAEEDLRLRGAGEVLGTQQSGLPAYRLADPLRHANLLAAARDDAQLIIARDPELKSPRGEALRHLLYLFERDEAIRLLDAG